MQYEWEQNLTPEILAEIDDLLPDGMHLVAVAVDWSESAEGALIVHPEIPTGGVLMADLWKDIYGDASMRYQEAIDRIYPN